MRSKIGGYRLGRKIGQGERGAVYTARHTDGDPVALKVTLRSLEHTSTVRDRLVENEIAAMRGLAHPALTDVHDAGFTPDGRLYVAMEPISGERLDLALARRGRLDAIEAMEIVETIGDAIAECHDAGLLHLDLRPRNIVLTDGGVKLLDTGLAQLGAVQTSPDALPYLSPERFEAAAPDGRDDIYALGVILYELLVGHPPFRGDSVHEIYGEKCRDALPPASLLAVGLPPAVDRVIDRLLRSAREERPASARWLSRELRVLARCMSEADGPRAGDHGSAARFHLAAGTDSSEPVAAQHLRLALESAALMSGGEERDRLLARATFELTAISAGEDETLAHINRCAAALDRPTIEHRAMLEAAYARAHFARGDLARATRHGDACLGLAAGEQALVAYTLVPMALSALVQTTAGAFGPAADLLGRVADLAHGQREWRELAHATSLRGLALAYTGDLEQAHCWVTRGVELAARLRHPSLVMVSRLSQALVAEAKHDTELGLRASATALEVASSEDGGLYLFLATLFAGRQHYHAANLSHAMLLLTRAFGVADRFDLGIGHGLCHAFLGDCLFVTGDVAAAERCYQRAIELAGDGAGDAYGGPIGLIGQAHCLARRGCELRDIQWRIDRACARLERARNASVTATVLDRATTIWTDHGDVARAQQAERAAIAAFESLGVPPRSWSPIGSAHLRPRRARRARTIIGAAPPPGVSEPGPGAGSAASADSAA